jgi:hypothetical protein
LGFAAGDENLYRYVGNDATDLADFAGLDDKPVKTYQPPPGLLPVLVAPTGNELRNPALFPEVVDMCDMVGEMAQRDNLEHGIGVYMWVTHGTKYNRKDRYGKIQFGPMLKPGTHTQIDLTPTLTPPHPGMVLICVIHSHPPDPDPTKADPGNSDLDPVNSNNSGVPWLVTGPDGTIYLIGPNNRGGLPNGQSR